MATMTAKVFLFLLLFIYSCADDKTGKESSGDLKVKYLDPGTTIYYTPLEKRLGFFDNELRIYCYRGNPKVVTRMFESMEIQIDIENDDYTQYKGETPEEVRQHYEDRQSLFSLSLFSQKRARLQLSPFNQQCIGIETLQSYRVHLEQLPVDFWRVILISLGISLFVYAAKLSQDAIFYYITGVMLGICFSFLLLIWLFSKLLPRKTLVYGTLVGGWAIGIYMIQMIWENLQTIILTYRAYVLWYLLTTGLISFFFCYRWGPPKDQRSKNIIKWCLQLSAIALIYISTQFEEAGVAAAILTIIIYYFPLSVLRKARSLYLKIFPPKRRFLTNEEYYEQGVRETNKALDELRAYASSPECNQWKVMTRLSNPRRFAAFVEGSSHLKDEEILNFENYDHDVEDEAESDSETDNENADENANENANENISNNNIRQRIRLFERRNNHQYDDDEDDDDEDGSFLDDSLAYRETRKLNSFQSRASQQRNVISSPNYPDSPSSTSFYRRRTPTRSALLVEKARETRRTPPVGRNVLHHTPNAHINEHYD